MKNGIQDLTDGEIIVIEVILNITERASTIGAHKMMFGITGTDFQAVERADMIHKSEGNRQMISHVQMMSQRRAPLKRTRNILTLLREFGKLKEENKHRMS